MDVYQLQLTCPSCGGENKIILSSGVSAATCSGCGNSVLRAKRFAGVIYVMANSRVSGVKIGMTRHDAFKRAKQVSGTGVPGQFSVMAVFPSHNPIKDERKVHEKLSRFHISKEHFELDAATAVAKVRTSLGRDPAFVARELEKPLAELLAHQRERTKGRFGAKRPTEAAAPLSGPTNLEPDLFSEEEVDHESPRPGPRGFLATLFT